MRNNKTPYTIICIVSIICLLMGSFLVYQEWVMRLPDDWGDDVIPIAEKAASESDISINMDTVPFVTEEELFDILETSSYAIPLPLLLSVAMPKVAPSAPVVVRMEAPRLRADEIGILTLKRKRFHIRKGVAEKILEKHIGWVDTSALPGEEGLSVIQGHRDHELRALKGMKRGDKIAVTLADGTTFIFTVKSIATLENSEAIDYTNKYDHELMITTCYPFYFTGKAPQKYVLRAAL